VDLAPVRESGLVLAEIARAPGIGDKPGKALADRLAAATADERSCSSSTTCGVRRRSGGSSRPVALAGSAERRRRPSTSFRKAGPDQGPVR